MLDKVIRKTQVSYKQGMNSNPYPYVLNKATIHVFIQCVKYEPDQGINQYNIHIILCSIKSI